MFPPSSRRLDHDLSSPASLSQVHRGRTARPAVTKIPAAILRQGIWDRELDGSPPKGALNCHLGLELLAVLARLGLSSLLTGGFVAGLSLHTGATPTGPHFNQACAYFFFWALALISCTTSRRA